MTQTSDDLARQAREDQRDETDPSGLPSTHEDAAADTDTKQWIRYTAISAAIVVGGVLLVKFVLNPWLYQYFLDNPLTSADIEKRSLIEKYEITSIETSTKTTGYGKYGSHSVTYYVIDGTMRDCKVDGPKEDPVLTCVGWQPPLRPERAYHDPNTDVLVIPGADPAADSATDSTTSPSTDPVTGLGASDPTTEGADVITDPNTGTVTP